MNKWFNFASKDGPHPGPIDNRALWYAIFNKKHVERTKDYYVVNQKVWDFLHNIYAGGPILHKEKREVNFETVSMMSSITSFEGTNIGNMVTDTVSQSDIGATTLGNGFRLSINNDGNETSSNYDSMRGSILKTQGGMKLVPSYFKHTIQEEPQEDEAEKPKNITSDTQSELPNGEQQFKETTEANQLRDMHEEEEEEEEYEGEESEETISNWEFNIIGLKNPANFWYMNVWLQALLSINELVEYYLKINPNDLLKLAKISKRKGNVSYLFALFCHEALIEDRNDAYNPVTIQKITEKIFSTQMQDTHEFFLYFFSKLQDEENKFRKALLASKGLPVPKEPDTAIEKTAESYWQKYKESHSSVIDKLFTGLSSSSVVRKWCGKVSKNYEPFFDISLEINSKSVNGCLRDYFLDEKIGVDSKYFWDNCKSNTKAVIRKRIERTPKHLIIHLKRFAYPSLKKDRTLISYKHTLDISKYVDSKTCRDQSTEYELFGMIIHKGLEMDRGHYICLFKREDRWYEFDDDKVYEIQGKEYTKYVLDKEIYMLLYKQCDEP